VAAITAGGKLHRAEKFDRNRELTNCRDKIARQSFGAGCGKRAALIESAEQGNGSYGVAG
jgi:hypothetical protein